jgi:AcrR family transcriptional regulator
MRAPGIEGEASSTKDRIKGAALLTLSEVGFAATTARAIAKRGGFAPGVIYYHFDSVEDLLLAALEETSKARLGGYRARLAGVTELPEFVQAMKDLYDEDIAKGHVAAVQEMVAGAASSPDLGPRVVENLGPWMELAEEMIDRFLTATPLGSIIPPEQLAYAVVAFYLGLETLTHLDGDRSKPDELFATAAQLAVMFDALFPRQDPSPGGGVADGVRVEED